MSISEIGGEIYFVGNRFSQLFERTVDQLNGEFRGSIAPTILRYWDTYFGPAPSLPQDKAEWRVLDLIAKKTINPLANKRQLPALLTEFGVDAVAPATYLSPEQAMAHEGEPVAIWFCKSIYGTGGKNMFCVANEDLEKTELPPNFVIQAGVRNIALIDGKKFTSRIYVLIWNGQVFLYRNGFLMVHAAPFDEGSTDYTVQIDHFGYDQPDSPVKMYQLGNYPAYEEVFEQYVRLIKTIKPVFAATLAESSKDRYILLGIDTLIQTDGSVKLIEINTFPNFVHTREIIEEVNIPFFTSSIRTMLGEPDAALVEI